MQRRANDKANLPSVARSGAAFCYANKYNYKGAIMENICIFKYKRNGERQIFPAHPFVENWLFSDDEEDEANLAYFMAKIAQKNGLSKNDMLHIFPLVMRMLESNSDWTK